MTSQTATVEIAEAHPVRKGIKMCTVETYTRCLYFLSLKFTQPPKYWYADLISGKMFLLVLPAAAGMNAIRSGSFYLRVHMWRERLREQKKFKF